LKNNLKDVTLIIYETRPENFTNSINALNKCCESTSFAEVKFISDISPENLPKEYLWEFAPHIFDINDYNLYMFKEMYRHINTSHALCIHSHSWILNPLMWDDKWLEYDYIGAPWVIKNDAYISWGSKEHVRVGNGGFSLRSKRLLELPKIHDLPLLQEQGWYNEDGNLVSYYRELMLALGIKYAPVEVAAKFAYENPVPENNYGDMKTFGFHRNRRINE